MADEASWLLPDPIRRQLGTDHAIPPVSNNSVSSDRWVKSLDVVYRGSVTGDPGQALMAWMVGSSVSSFAGSTAARERVMTSMPR